MDVDSGYVDSQIIWQRVLLIMLSLVLLSKRFVRALINDATYMGLSKSLLHVENLHFTTTDLR